MWVGLKYCQRSKVTVWDERFSDYSRNLSLFLESWESKYIKLDNHKCSQGLEVPASNNFFYNQDVIICSWKACFLLNKMNIVLLGRFQRGTFFDGLSVFQPATWILFYVFHLKVGKLNLCGSEMRRERVLCSEVINGKNCCSFFLSTTEIYKKYFPHHLAWAFGRRHFVLVELNWQAPDASSKFVLRLRLHTHCSSLSLSLSLSFVSAFVFAEAGYFVQICSEIGIE